MNEQGNLLNKAFNDQLARTERDRGEVLALTAEAVQRWKTTARAWILRQDPGTWFTADHVVMAVGLPTESDLTAKCNNALGGLFAGLARQGEIRADAYTTSSRVSNHARVLRVWVRL